MAASIDPVYLILDLGNSLWKFVLLWMDGGAMRRHELVMPHALVEDNDGSRFRNVQMRYSHRDIGEKYDPDWFAFNGSYYVAGVSAESQGLVSRLTGAAKYEGDYFRACLTAGLMYLLPDGHTNLHVFSSFPPEHASSMEKMIAALIGKWEVETTAGKANRYHVRSVQPFDEPLGGYIRAITDADGIPYKDNHLEKGSTLVIDIGGKISNVLRIAEGGRVQYGTARSFDIGIQDVERAFIDALKTDYPELRTKRSFDQSLIRAALATGRYQYKGEDINCVDAVLKSTTTIMNRLGRHYNQDFDDGDNDRHVLITGGGGGALFNLIKDTLKHKRMFAAENADAMHLANVRGGERLCRASLIRAGVYKPERKKRDG